MNRDRLAEWLTNLLGDDYQRDISKLRDELIDGCTFKDLDESGLRQIGVSFGFRKTLLNIIKNMQTHGDISETLSSQQQSLTSMAATPTSPAAEKKSKLVRTPVDEHPTFSKDMGHEQLAVWLRNHPSLTGADYEEDIRKLMDARINGFVFLNLNESRLSQFGISLGFKFAIMSIIEDMRMGQQPTKSDERLPRDSVAISKTQHQSTYSEKLKPKIGFLGLSDLRRVQNTLWDARTQWYNLGLDLDISPDSLDSIELANAGNPERCFRAMLTKWLREYHRPTWSALAEALKSPSVGLSHLAEEINS